MRGLIGQPEGGDHPSVPIKANFMEGLDRARVLHLPPTVARKGLADTALAYGRTRAT